MRRHVTFGAAHVTSPALRSPDLREAIRLAARNRRVALGLTQADLAARPGALPETVKRFEPLGGASQSSLLAVADALDALDDFHELFPPTDAHARRGRGAGQTRQARETTVTATGRDEVRLARSARVGAEG